MHSVTIFLLVAIAVVALILWLWYRYRPIPNPTPEPRPSRSASSRRRSRLPADHEVVGALIPSGVEPAQYVTGSVINLGDPDISYPVGTLLVEESPPSVQLELLTRIPQGPLRGIEVPESFDCRQKWPGLISEAYHQGSCGSCWAFASAMAVSDRIRIANPDDAELKKRFIYRPFVDGQNVQYPVINNLSPYYLVSCDTCGSTFRSFPQTTEYVAGNDLQCDNGCEGGYLQLVYDFMMTSGVPTLLSAPTSCDPTVQDCPCTSTPDAKIYKPSRVYSLVAPNETKETRRRRIMEDVFQKGPVSIGFKVYQSFYDFFAQNPTGVYSNLVRPQNDRPIGGHAVVIVGWGMDENGTFYWIMRNSWGIAWGDQGYFKMQYDFEGILENVMAGEA